MSKQFENMQKLAFGKILIKESMEGKKMTKKAFKEQIREMILDEAKKKKDKPEDVAPQEDVDVDLNIGDEQPSVEPSLDGAPTDTMAPETGGIGDIDPTVKSIQDSLQKAFAQAKQLGDAKLATQIGNTLTMLLRDQVLGQQNVNEVEELEEEILSIEQMSLLKELTHIANKYFQKLNHEEINVVIDNLKDVLN
jgi:hypothetical protein